MTAVQREKMKKESCTTSDVARIGIGSWVDVDGKQSESSSLVWVDRRCLCKGPAATP